MRRIRLAVALFLLVLVGCSREASQSAQPSPSSTAAAVPEDARWLLEGTNDDRFVRVSKHLRGFDMAMVETAHRYQELYWAGRDQNWEYATYQLGKLELAVANGAERRPRRAASAKMLESAVSGMRQAIKSGDATSFDTAFSSLTATCNACHQAERVPFIRIELPVVRTSIVHITASGTKRDN